MARKRTKKLKQKELVEISGGRNLLNNDEQRMALKLDIRERAQAVIEQIQESFEVEKRRLLESFRNNTRLLSLNARIELIDKAGIKVYNNQNLVDIQNKWNIAYEELEELGKIFNLQLIGEDSTLIESYDYKGLVQNYKAKIEEILVFFDSYVKRADELLRLEPVKKYIEQTQGEIKFYLDEIKEKHEILQQKGFDPKEQEYQGILAEFDKIQNFLTLLIEENSKSYEDYNQKELSIQAQKKLIDKLRLEVTNMPNIEEMYAQELISKIPEMGVIVWDQSNKKIGNNGCFMFRRKYKNNVTLVELCDKFNRKDPLLIIPKRLVDNDGFVYNIVTIEENAFSFSNIESLIMRGNIQTLGRACFYDCQKLKSITIPSSVQKIENGCFNGCKELRSVVFNGKVMLRQNLYDCFSGCHRIQSFTFNNIDLDDQNFMEMVKINMLNLANAQSAFFEIATYENKKQIVVTIKRQ